MNKFSNNGPKRDGFLEGFNTISKGCKYPVFW
jgi:hypothetical protein